MPAGSEIGAIGALLLGETPPDAPGGDYLPPWMVPLFGRRARRAAVLPPDLLSAVVAYLRGLAPSLGLSGGVYDELAPAATTPPFLVLHGYAETLPGETLDDEPVSVTAMVVSPSLDQARAVGAAVKAALDSPNLSPRSLARASFAFQGGAETGLTRETSRPYRVPGAFAPGGGFVYVEEVPYTFWVTPGQ